MDDRTEKLFAMVVEESRNWARMLMAGVACALTLYACHLWVANKQYKACIAAALLMFLLYRLAAWAVSFWAVYKWTSDDDDEHEDEV